MKEFNKKIVLEDGEEYYGYGFGADQEAICEIVFNTSMVGYQEIVSDPSYTYQMVVMTYPLIGNYGITDDDYETKQPTIGGMIVREYNDLPSNFRYTKTLSEYLEENDIPGIAGIDTRKLTRSIREKGSRKVIITDISTSKQKALKKLKENEIPRDAVEKVSCKKKWYSRTANPNHHIVAIDCGIKLNIVRSLNKRGCNVTVVPYNTAAKEIINLKPDGIFLSNGPGDPEDVKEVIKNWNSILSQFGRSGQTMLEGVKKSVSESGELLLVFADLVSEGYFKQDDSRQLEALKTVISNVTGKDVNIKTMVSEEKTDNAFVDLSQLIHFEDVEYK